MKVNEIFYSLQGEGHFTGTPAIFLRLSGCNMKCWFCDTQHEEHREMTEEEILEAVGHYPSRHIVITGGEPLMQLNERLTSLLHEYGYFIQIETNGTLPLPEGVEIDWITCSPKGKVEEGCYYHSKLQRIDEIKVVYENEGQNLSVYDDIPAKEFRLQPCDVKDNERNDAIISATIKYILAHPKWQLSLQTHKLLNIP